jgi:antitoxin (DNA-binding transcriptional repressor) of toxin-antitoxin stability system
VQASGVRRVRLGDAVGNGQAFTVTRDGHQIGELVPLRHRRRFVPRQEFAAMSRSASGMDIETFRADQEAAFDNDVTSPYDQ